MTFFLDEQGVGPCGHSARDKGILISVLTSCLSHQVPRQLAYSVRGCRNDKNTGDLIASTNFLLAESIADDQYTKGIASTVVLCGQNSIQDKCLCLPQANWQAWSARQRIHTVRVNRGIWRMVMFVDDDETILRLLEHMQSHHPVDPEDYGQVLKSGWGEGPTDEEQAAVMKPYEIYQTKPKH